MAAVQRLPSLTHLSSTGDHSQHPTTMTSSNSKSPAVPTLKSKPDVAAVYQSYPPKLRRGLLKLRSLVFSVAAELDEVCSLQEVLRWNTPSYLVPARKSVKIGTTLRLGVEAKTPDQFGLYVPCSTTLVSDYQQLYGDLFHYNGKRGLLFDSADELPLAELRHCIALALTYHVGKRGSQQSRERA